MEVLHIEGTKYTPAIKLDPVSHNFSIIGKSYMENTFEFYKPVVEWIENYFSKVHNESITFLLELIYFNSSSSVQFFDIFDIIEDAHNNGFNININWLYDEENDVALESGEDYKDDFTDLNFNLLSK